MVGKNLEAKSSHIFHQCYVKCCKLQNINPVNGVIPGANGNSLDFCVDRIKYVEWAPILNALSCDLSLHSISIRCRQQVKTVLEHVDCERLAKAVNKRAVILTNFMLSNLVEAVAQCLSGTTLLSALLLEGLPLKIPYLNPLVQALHSNNSLQHLHLPRACIGDAGCLAVCNALRVLPNILTVDLSSCDLTQLGAGYIADVIKYQKIHRYSENWKHTLRYRLPQLETMSGLRRITLCGNAALGDRGAALLMDTLADDLWIKAVDFQWCGLSESSATAAGELLRTNKTLAVLDLRHNADISGDSLLAIRGQLRENERGFCSQQYNWLNSNGSSVSCADKKAHITRSVTSEVKERFGRSKSNGRRISKTGALKKDKDREELSEQLAEEVAHRRQLEELNLQLIHQMRQLKQQAARMWNTEALSADLGSERSCSERSEPCSSWSGSSSVTIDHNTLSYIQQAFKDIYAFIQNNQCKGDCVTSKPREAPKPPDLAAKRARSTHEKVAEFRAVSKTTKSACAIGERGRLHPGVFERQMGDTLQARAADDVNDKAKYSERNGSCSSTVSGSSETLAHTPRAARCLNPRDAFLSSEEED